jgi:hypothetical protein
MKEEDDFKLSIEERVSRLEGKIGWLSDEFVFKPKMFWYSLATLGMALFFSYIGLGLPNHYYQIVFAILLVALGYHRNWFAKPMHSYQWLAALLNVAVLSMLFKLLIGAGKAQPLSWVKLPYIESSKVSEGWTTVLPRWELAWEQTALSQWIIDITIFQTFLLLITLLGALFKFQPFISLTAFLLIIVSLPSLLSFSWTWVFPAIITAGIGFYLQSPKINRDF